jgi:hypothetical protein
VTVDRTNPESVAVLEIIVKLMVLAVADECEAVAAIDAVIVQVPGATNAIKPVEELMVQTEVVELV